MESKTAKALKRLNVKDRLLSLMSKDGKLKIEIYSTLFYNMNLILSQKLANSCNTCGTDVWEGGDIYQQYVTTDIISPDIKNMIKNYGMSIQPELPF